MIKSFSVARPGEPSQPRLPICRELAEHISQLAAKHAAPDFEPRTVERQPVERPEPWWRDMWREKADECFRLAVAGGFPDRLPLDSVVALAGLTAEGMADPPVTDEIFKRLSRLLEVGLLRQDDDGLISRESVRSAWGALDLPEHGALAFWSGKATVAAEAPKSTSVPVAAPQAAPANRRGDGRKTEAINRTIQDVTSQLEKGDIEWDIVSLAALAKWLCRAGGPLAGEDSETVRRSYLDRKNLADPACPKGKQPGGAEQKAFAALDAAWKRAEAERQSTRAPLKLAASQ